MDPNNMAGMPGTQNTNSNEMLGAAPAPNPVPQRSDAAIEMQAAIVADQIANPAGKQPQENPMVAAAPVRAKGGKSSLIAIIIFAVIAVAGVGFGVWMMMDSNSKETEFNNTISSLKKQNNDLLDQVAELNEKVENGASDGGDTIINIDTNTPTTNPVISATSPESYHTSFRYSGLSISLVDGTIASCNYNDEATCSVEGLSGKIYKMNYLAVGNGINGSERFAFLMEDGSVFGVSPYERSDSGVFVAKKLNIDGFVKDIIEADYTADMDNPTGWIMRTVFVMNDNSIMGYSESML